MQNGAYHTLRHQDVLDLMEELKRITTPRNQTRIDLLLNSLGGDIHAAYKLVKVLRSKCGTLNVIVPYYAKSAATLIALGGDKIYMGQHSELGPLDAVIEHPLAEGTRLSALDGVKPLDFLAGYCEALALEGIGLRIRNEVELGRQESLDLTLDFLSRFVEPIMRQLNPVFVNMCVRYLQVAEKYGGELLREYMFKNKSHADEMADSTIFELVWEYPEHAYAIGIDEARRLNLEVEEVEPLLEWERLWTYYKEREEMGGKHIHIITDQILGSAPS